MCNWIPAGAVLLRWMIIAVQVTVVEVAAIATVPPVMLPVAKRATGSKELTLVPNTTEFRC